MKSYLFVFVIVFLSACKEPTEKPIVDPAENTLFEVPENFPDAKYAFDKNPITEEGFHLGRKLFYDGKLSRDGTISCAECHSQTYAFTHHGHTLSHGIDNNVGFRNAPPIQNTAFTNTFFWDGGVFDLDLFSLAPIENPAEMDEKIGNVLEKLKADENYPVLFKAAYGSEEITTERFLKALSQFMNTLVSSNSKYDKYIRNEAGGEFTNDELQGLQLFENKCAVCHSGSLFSDSEFRNNGLEIYFRDEDTGRMRITGEASDSHKFKVPSLRNVKYTAPYMHNGEFRTLEAVLTHYQNGVYSSETLDPILQKNGTLGIPMNNTEKRQIITFLKTLSDSTFISDPRFSAP